MHSVRSNLILFYVTTHAASRYLNRSACNSSHQVGDWPLFYHGIQQNVQQWTDLVKRATAKGQLDIFITDIWDNLEALSKRRFPSFLPKTKIVPWWSPELTALRKQVNALKRRVKRCKNTDLKEISKALRPLKTYTEPN